MKQRLLLLATIAIVALTQSYAQGFRIYKNGAVIGTYSSERFDSISFFLKSEYEAIDLGLPSGTLWADKNVGANDILDDGWYVSWGETSEKDEYQASTYKWEVFTDYENYYFTKYTESDGLKSLQAEDDVATIIIGDEWSTPSQVEWQELIDKCSWVWTSANGNNGYSVTGPNGNKIFIAASGRKDTGSFFWHNEQGCYWTSDRAGLLGGKELYAYEFFFGKDFKRFANTNRDGGLPVRAVKRESAIEVVAVDLGLPSGTKWADKNVGASTETEDGWYVSWGETMSKEDYSEGNYKWALYSNNAIQWMTKYNQTDGLSTLQTKDDVASVVLGEEWSLPTYNEWLELMLNCTWTWNTNNGVKGYTITGTNGNKIFLAACGRKDTDSKGTKLSWHNEQGCYWSSTIGRKLGELEYYAYEIYIDSNSRNLVNSNRNAGLTVRAVKR